MVLAGRPQARGGIFRGHVTLRHAEHFEADHELAHGRRAQQRRIEVRVQVPLGVRLAVARPLVEAHRVGKRRFEQAVVARRHPLEHVGERVAFGRRQVVQPPMWRRGMTSVSNGHTAQKGTSATNASFSQPCAPPLDSSTAR